MDFFRAAATEFYRHATAGLGALLGIVLTGLISALAFGKDAHLPLIVAPIGASAVLLFSVPASPLARLWAIIGGNTVSALVGVAVRHAVHEPMAATGLAVGLAIIAMALARCLHPPGGAAALTAILGGPSVAAAGAAFPFVPVCLNAILLVLFGAAFHRFWGNSYPHIAAPSAVPSQYKDQAARSRPRLAGADIEDRLEKSSEACESERSIARLCGSGQRVVKATALREADLLPLAADAQELLEEINLRDVTDLDDAALAQLPTLPPNAPLSQLISTLATTRAKAVAIVDSGNRLVGLITPHDALAALAAAYTKRRPLS